MTEKQEPTFLGKLVSVVVLLAAALYFTGWIYRWAYFSFFQVEIPSLNFPVESFYIAAFQALFGHPLTVLRTILVFILTTVAILLSLQLLHQLVLKSVKKISVRLNSIHFNSIRFLRSLVDEAVIVLWVLGILFYLAQQQGDADARKDAINETSSLPKITLVSSAANAPIGRKLDDPFSSPSNFRIIGDLERYKDLLTKDLTDTSDPNKPIIWRLLLDSDRTYIFPALPKQVAQSNKDFRPLVLVLSKSGNGDQLLILSPPTD